MFSKKTNILMSVPLLLVLLLTGCSSSTGSGIGVSTGEIKAKIDGSTWKASGGTAVKSTANIEGTSVTAVTVTGAHVIDTNTGESEVVTITIYGGPGEDNISEAKYDVSEDEAPGAQFSFSLFVNDEMVNYFSTSGTVEVNNASDDNIKGTFEGTVQRVGDTSDTKEIEKGEFNTDIGFSFGF